MLFTLAGGHTVPAGPQRFSVRPGAYGHYHRQTMEDDVAGVLLSIRTPTLVLNRTGNLAFSEGIVRDLLVGSGVAVDDRASTRSRASRGRGGCPR